ncbi:MAG TPA: hypothetical protein VJA66_05625 [Thermoanaerobaculia bacterium]
MRSPRFSWPSLALVLFLLPALASITLDRAASASPAQSVSFKDAASQAAEFIGYNRSIALNPDQTSLRDRALSSLAAPCCSKFSAATCCCPCNLAKSIWGLSNYLIVRQSAGEKQIQENVKRWLAFVNAQGFSGDVCDTAGGCGRTFARNGCGGMNENNLAAAR